MEGEIYVDPDEDEVFFRPVATQAQLEALEKRRKRKTLVFRPMAENKENVSANIPNTISPMKKNMSYREALDDDEQDVRESTHNTTPIFDFEDIACLDEEDDLDSLFMDCAPNESLVSWASVDVNTQLESLVANMENLLDDENDAPDMFNLSSTPKKSEESFNLLTTPKMTLKADNDGGYLSALSEAAVAVSRENSVPRVVVTEATPDQEGEKSPLVLASTQRKIHRPLRLVYKNEDSSSSSGSLKSFHTPAASNQSTPFRKPTLANIPKSSGLKPIMTSGSKIPRGIQKQSASKSLLFQHIESPISKYIYQKSTPLVCNVKPQKKAWVVEEMPKKDESAPKRHDMPELPAARYQKGIPLKQDNFEESKLPRMGPVQMNKIKPLSPRVVKHKSRNCDVSVLVSSEAKISKTPKK